MFSGPGHYKKNYLHILCGSYFSILRTSLCVKLRINLNKQAHHQHEMWFNFPIVFFFCLDLSYTTTTKQEIESTKESTYENTGYRDDKMYYLGRFSPSKGQNKLIVIHG